MSINRPPLNQGGFPSGNRLRPQAVNTGPLSDPCARLAALNAALDAIATGNQTLEVRDGDRVQRFNAVNMRELKMLIAKVEIQCKPHQRRAVRVGPRLPNGPGYGWPFGTRFPY